MHTMLKQGCLLPLLLASSLFAQIQTPRQTAEPFAGLRCELQHQAEFADTLSARPWSHFHFILFSGRDGLRVFADWNSWGYFARSFTLTDSHSNQFHVAARNHIWDRNYPGTDTINRGEVLVTDVDLCDRTWQVTPKLPLKENDWTVVGHYALQLETDPLYLRNFHTDEVWHGTIDSPPVQFFLTKECILRLNSVEKHPLPLRP
jgi:hypothetical protein